MCFFKYRKKTEFFFYTNQLVKNEAKQGERDSITCISGLLCEPIKLRIKK